MDVSSPHRCVAVDVDGKPSVQICFGICLNRGALGARLCNPNSHLRTQSLAGAGTFPLSSWTDGFPTASPVTLPHCFLLMDPGEHIRSSLLHEESLRQSCSRNQFVLFVVFISSKHNIVQRWTVFNQGKKKSYISSTQKNQNQTSKSPWAEK